MIYLLSTIFIFLYGFVFKVNKNDRSKKLYLTISFGIMMIISALRKYTVGIDMKLLYAPMFEAISQISFFNLGNVNLEQGYVFLCKILSMISKNTQILIVFTSVFIFLSYGRFIYKNSKDVLASTMLFLILDIFFMCMNIVRQEIAVAILLWGYEYLKDNKIISYALIILVASLFHQSAILCLLFIFFYKSKFTKKSLVIGLILMLFGLVFYAPLVNGITNLLSLLGLNSNKDYTVYLTSKAYGLGIFNLDTLSKYVFSFGVFILSYYYIVVLKKNEDKNDNFLMYMSMMYFIVAIVSSQMIIISRLEYYLIPFILIAIPNVISKSNNKSNKLFINLIIYTFLMAKYIYIYMFLADILYGVIPYSFFWK